MEINNEQLSESSRSSRRCNAIFLRSHNAMQRKKSSLPVHLTTSFLPTILARFSNPRSHRVAFKSFNFLLPPPPPSPYRPRTILEVFQFSCPGGEVSTANFDSPRHFLMFMPSRRLTPSMNMAGNERADYERASEEFRSPRAAKAEIIREISLNKVGAAEKREREEGEGSHLILPFPCCLPPEPRRSQGFTLKTCTLSTIETSLSACQRLGLVEPGYLPRAGEHL